MPSPRTFEFWENDLVGEVDPEMVEVRIDGHDFAVNDGGLVATS